MLTSGMPRMNPPQGFKPGARTKCSVDFYIPELTVRPNDYILTRETAVQVVLAFLEMAEWPTCYEEMPDCVEWEEL